MLAVAYQARDVAGLLRDSRSGQHYRVPMPAEETGIMHLARLIKNRREELGRPPAIQPVTRRVSPETEKIIKVLEANGVTDAERKALYDFLVARVNARPETGERRHRAG